MSKKICYINCSARGSTGNIIKNIISHCGSSFSYCAILGDKASYIDPKHVLSIGYNSFLYKICRGETFIFGNDGFMSAYYKTKIKRFLEKEKPDIIHIHNPHRSFCNVEVVLKYAIANKIKVIWTVHDLWPTTGRCCCPIECHNRNKGCGNCPHKNFYPRALIDRSAHFYKKKLELYNLIGNDLTFVCPSEWSMENINNMNTCNNKLLIRNGIDTNVFKMQESKNENIILKAKGRFIIGGAALYFNATKGADDFTLLADRLDKNKYFIALIGGENKEIEMIKENIMLIPKTFSPSVMAEFYNSINVFFNPTQADNYPTTHLESISCGTPVITYDVGGAKEMIEEGKSGFAVKANDIDAVVNSIKCIRENQELFSRNKVVSFADFSLKNFCEQYKKMYLYK